MSKIIILHNRETQEKQAWREREKCRNDFFRFGPVEFEALVYPRRDLQ